MESKARLNHHETPASYRTPCAQRKSVNALEPTISSSFARELVRQLWRALLRVFQSIIATTSTELSAQRWQIKHALQMQQQVQDLAYRKRPRSSLDSELCRQPGPRFCARKGALSCHYGAGGHPSKSRHACHRLLRLEKIVRDLEKMHKLS